ncbi:OmpH family outer membrane protein [Polycyclovorans algicola]|uniref:OmpH family outer membrane protein n=1 Tax=Polycyclovorans algicola TaxID=616992 RepID=UPI0004A6E82A|nr:OmpH family outer membrane protein [Polycyclovorans algicola]
MFQKTFTVAILFAALAAAAPLSVHAQGDLKIGAIRTADIVLESPQFKAGAERMKAEFERRQADLQAGAKKFQEDAEKFQREADFMANDARATREKDLNSRRIDLGLQQRQLQEDMQNRDRELTEDMRERINAVITEVAGELGYDLVVQDPAFASEAMDITDEVLQRLKAKP